MSINLHFLQSSTIYVLRLFFTDCDYLLQRGIQKVIAAVTDADDPTEEELVGNAAALIGSALLEVKEAGSMVSEVAAASTIRAHIILNEEAISNLFESDHSGKHVVYRCRICLYTSLKKNNIENHVVTHTDLQAFKCQLCPYKSNFKKDLMDHCNLNHQVASAWLSYCTVLP